MPLRLSKDINRLLNEPTLRGDVTPEMKKVTEEKVQAIIDRRGKAKVEEMRVWGSWGGNFSLEAMAKKAGAPPELYALLYTMESRAPHALDVASHVRLNPDKSLTATLPALAERHLVPSTTTVLVALRMGTEALKISGFNAEMETLLKRAENMKASGAASS